jgi:hypothetical protein
MSRTTPASSETPPDGAPVVLVATRPRPPGWRDPRLVVGVVIVAGCVVLGSLLFAASDSTVLVWGVRSDVPAGLPLTGTELVQRRVRLAGPGTAPYLRVDHGSPVGRVLVRAVASGELLPAAAIARAVTADVVQVPLEVAVGDLPATLRPGDRVDVWSVPKDASTTTSADQSSSARRLLADVLVIGLPSGADPLAPTTTRAVLVQVPATDDLADLLGATADARIVLTHRQGGRR